MVGWTNKDKLDVTASTETTSSDRRDGVTASHLDRHLLSCGAMSDYDFRPGGSLKLKGGVVEGGIVKKCVPYT